MRATRPLTRPVVQASIAGSVSVPGVAPAFPWPAVGQAAVSVPALGYAAQSAPEAPVPIASLTKMTTALVVLRDHPLAPGASGPLITVTADDAAQFGFDTADDQSSVPVTTGEQLSERQMLEALLLPSANNIAYALAEWDAGSQAAFVAKMNAAAAGLGATSTHYVDASGFDTGSVSTAADCLRIAAAAMRIPAFAQIVAMPSAPFPMAGTISNVIGGVGAAGIVGVKSGFTSAAGGCLVLAGDRTVAGRRVQVLVAVLDQPVEPPPPPAKSAAKPPPAASTTTTTTTTTLPPTTGLLPTPPASVLQLPSAFQFAGPAALAILTSAESGIVPVTVSRPGSVVATVTASWGGRRHTAAVVTAAGAEVLARPGQRIDSATRLHRVPAGATGGRQMGDAFFWLGSQLEAVPLRLTTTVSEPTWWWRVLHG